MRYAKASRKSASLIRTSHGGKTPAACSATSVAVERMKIASKPASTAPMRRSPRRGRCVSLMALSCIDHDLEPTPEHALAVERHVLRVHHLRQALVLHDLGHDAVAMRARLVHDVREHHRLAGFELDALRERRALAWLDVVGRALVVLEGAVLAPDFSGQPRQTAIGGELSLRYRYHYCIDVVHWILLGWLSGRGRRSCSGRFGKRRERKRDRHGAEADRARVDVHPRVLAEGVEDPAADGRPERHAEARHHGGRAEHRAEDALPEVLAREDRVERHHAAVGKAEDGGDGVELAEPRSGDERE